MTSKLLNFLNRAYGLSLWAMPFSVLSVALGYLALWLNEPSGAVSVRLGAHCLAFELVNVAVLLCAIHLIKSWGATRGRR